MTFLKEACVGDRSLLKATLACSKCRMRVRFRPLGLRFALRAPSRLSPAVFVLAAAPVSGPAVCSGCGLPPGVVSGAALSPCARAPRCWVSCCGSWALCRLTICGSRASLPQVTWGLWTRDRTHVSRIGGQILYHWAPGKPTNVVLNCPRFFHLSFLFSPF